MIRPRPSTAKLRIIVRRNTAIWALSPSRLAATWKRQFTGDPGSLTSRSITRSGSSLNCLLS